MKIGNNEITHIENGIMFTPIYDLEGVCQDCIYLEKIKPLFEEKDKEIERLNKIIEIKNNRIQQLMKRTRSARIDKAIEYIEEQSKFIKGCDIYRICNKDVLLNILKGSDKE